MLSPIFYDNIHSQTISSELEADEVTDIPEHRKNSMRKDNCDMDSLLQGNDRIENLKFSNNNFEETAEHDISAIVERIILLLPGMKRKSSGQVK